MWQATRRLSLVAALFGFGVGGILTLLPIAWALGSLSLGLLLTGKPFGFMALLYLLFSKIVPMISIWEMKVGLQPRFRVRTAAKADSKHHGLAMPGPLPTDVAE